MTAKQVRLLPATNDTLEKLVEYYQEINPHINVSKQSVVAELVVKAAKKELKKEAVKA